MKRTPLIIALAFSLPLFAEDPEPKEPVSLFNGTNLDGWVRMHGGGWTVEDGAIVGRKGIEWTTNPEKSGSWLRSEKEYGDFVFDPLQNHDDKAVVKFRNLRIEEKS